MSRPPRIIVPGYPYHIVLRGNNRTEIFRDDEDRRKFLEFLLECKKKTDSRLYAYCLMTNHGHFLIEASTEKGIGALIQGLGSRYVRYFNKRYQRTGTLWEGRFKSAVVCKDNYLLACSRYIELNPVRAKIVAQPEDYLWSSYNFKVRATPNELLDKDPVYESLAQTDEEMRKKYEEFVKQGVAEIELKRITQELERNGLFGDDAFKANMATKFGYKVKFSKRGRPKKV